MTYPPGPSATSDRLFRLERSLDGRMYRLAAKIGLQWRAARDERRRSKPTPLDVGSLRRDRPSAPELVTALSTALREGALDSAVQLIDSLDARFAELSGPLVTRAASLLVGGLITLGERDRAKRLAICHTQTLLRTAEGSTLLELLGLEQSPLWLPDGRPNLVKLNRCIGEGRVDVDQLIASLGARPWLALRSPELELLYFNALRTRDLPRACGFLNRFLSLRGLPSCRPKRERTDDGTSLFDLAFDTPPPVGGGPLVSVVMAARNAAPSVGFAIDSLLSQSYQAMEILVGDDASEDATAQILKGRYAGHPRVRLFLSRSNQGAYNLRNALLSRARGELFTFHDADDIALPTRIAAQVAELARPGAVACVTNWLRLDPQRGVVFFKDQAASRLCLVSLMVTRRAHQALGALRSAKVGADLERYAELRARFGEPAMRRIRQPLIWGLWSHGSSTRQPGCEALEDGYRSPARRSYSELVFAKRFGDSAPSEQEIDERLRAMGNYQEPSELSELR